MKTGTKSLLFGVHQILWHPFTVYLAWSELYGPPNWKEVVCILIHDWGYFGCEKMDGEDGRNHPEIAGRIAGKLLGEKYADMCFYHSRHYAMDAGKKPSRLCYADKLSIKYEVWWFYLLRAKLSGELIQYRKQAAESGHVPEKVPNKSWFKWIQHYLIGIGLGLKNYSAVSRLNR